MNECGHHTTIGSYPGEQRVSCSLPSGHAGDHEATVSWAHHWTDCEDASIPYADQAAGVIG